MSAGEPSLSVLQIYAGWILSFSGVFAGWPRWYYWCIAVHFRFLASKALHCTLYHGEHFSVSQFQAMNVDHVDMHPVVQVVNFQCSGGSIVPATILGPSERGVDYRTIM